MNVVEIAAIGTALGFGLGWLLGHRAARGEAAQMRRVRDSERALSEKTVAELHDEVALLREQTNDHGDALQFIPGLLNALFHASSPRTVGPIALKLVEHLFRPTQAAVFAARPGDKTLVLVAGTGLPPPLAPGDLVAFGEGRVGYVAQHRVAMDEADFRSAGVVTGEMLQSRRRIETPGVKYLRVDAAAPIAARDTLFGVVCVAGAIAARGREKKRLATLGELIGIALFNATRVRAVEESATLDGLTGVHNRAHLAFRLEEELREAERLDHALSVVALDLDHLEQYNLTNSSLQGDHVIKHVARLLKESVRENDVVARVGGGEFVVLYPGADKETSLRMADEVRQTVEKYPFDLRSQQPLGVVTVSLGVASFPEDSRSGVILLQAAKEALTKAKTQGRNRTVPARPNYLA